MDEVEQRLRFKRAFKQFTWLAEDYIAGNRDVEPEIVYQYFCGDDDICTIMLTTTRIKTPRDLYPT